MPWAQQQQPGCSSRHALHMHAAAAAAAAAAVAPARRLVSTHADDPPAAAAPRLPARPQCVSAGRLAAEFTAVNGGGSMPALPQGCAEVTPDFKCARCADGQSLTNGKCVAYNAVGGSGCKASNPLVQYCAKVGV